MIYPREIMMMRMQNDTDGNNSNLDEHVLVDNGMLFKVPGIMDNSFNNFSSIRPTPTATSQIQINDDREMNLSQKD